MRFARIFMAPAIVFGTSFAISLQFVLLTPFLVTLGVSRASASVIWIIGPLTGLIVQPSIGFISDEYHKRHATRLPLVLVGALVLILSHLLVAYTDSLSKFLHVSPVVVVVSAFWMFDASNNAIVVTSRAMLSDRFSKDQRTLAFSVLQFWNSIGSILGYLLAQVDWTTPTADPVTAQINMSDRVFYSFTISAIMVLIGTTLSLISVYEKRACRMRVHGPRTGESFQFRKLYINPTLVSILAGSALTWFGWFAQQIYQSDFVSSEIMNRTATTMTTSLSAVGLKASAFGLLISSGLSCLSGLVLPVLLSYTGSESHILFRVWSISCSLQGLVLIGSIMVSTIPGAIMWEASVGPMYAIACTVPYMLVANCVDHGSMGRIMAIVNVAVCFPQLIVSTAGGVLIDYAKTNTIMFMAGGILCIIATRILWVPSGRDVPPWSEKSTASLIASTSELFSFHELPPLQDRRIFDRQTIPGGLTSPRIKEPLLLPLLPDSQG